MEKEVMSNATGHPIDVPYRVSEWNETHPNDQVNLDRGHSVPQWIDPEVTAREAARLAEREADSHSPAHDTATPMALPVNGNIPAGWVSPDVADAAERERIRQQILAEQEEAAKAALESAVSQRISQNNAAEVAAGE